MPTSPAVSHYDTRFCETRFRVLPLTSGQDSEIRHYIHVRRRNGLPWDTAELHAMLAGMLDPPELDEADSHAES